MYAEGEEIYYYIALYNENHLMPPMPEGAADGILKGLYKFKAGPEQTKLKAHIFGSGPIIREALRAQKILAEQFDVSADVWSATSYKLLRNDALRAKRWNMLHPLDPPKKSYVETLLAAEQGVFVAVSDNLKIVPDQIAPWVPGGLTTLGTDGFGDELKTRCPQFARDQLGVGRPVFQDQYAECFAHMISIAFLAEKAGQEATLPAPHHLCAQP